MVYSKSIALDNDLQEKLVELIDLPDWKAMLFSIVKKESLDVWNVDIERLANAYYHKIFQMQEKNFRVSANAMLACSILLRIKAGFLKMPSIESEEKPLLEDIESVLPDLQPVQRIRHAGITLDELIKSIEEVMIKTEKNAVKKLNERKKNSFKFKKVAILEPDIEESLKKLYEQVRTESKNSLYLFSSLIEKKNKEEIVSVFFLLLFLVKQKKILLFQENFFNDVFIKIL